MEWLVFFGVVAWLAWTAHLWYRLLALRRAHALAVERLERCEERLAGGDARPVRMEQSPPAAPDQVGAIAMNFSRRVQILRRYRRGETAERIAAAIGAPAPEVELTIKLHGRAFSPVA